MPETIITTSEIWAQRFETIREAYDASGPDGSTPGASWSVQRFALLTVSERQGGYFLNYCPSISDVEKAAGANIPRDWMPICYYDLNELAGDPYPVDVGDVVSYAGDDYYVVHVSDDVQDGEIFHWFYLHPNSPEPPGWIDACQRVDQYECKIVKRSDAFEDSREPKCYRLAAVRTVVVFNTVSSSSLA